MSTAAPPPVPTWTWEGSWDRAKAGVRWGVLQARGLLLRGAVRSSALPPELSACGRIVVLRNDRLGDAVLTFPLVNAVKRLAPGSEVIYAVREAWAPLFSGQPHTDRVVALPRPPREQARVLAGIRPDLIIDPRTDPELETARLCRASKAPWRVGFSGHGRERYFTTYLSRPTERRHASDEVLQLLRLWCSDRVPSVTTPFLTVPAAGQAWWQGVAQDHRALGKGFVCVHPGAYYATQRWPEARFRELAERVALELGRPVVWVQPPERASVWRRGAADGVGRAPANRLSLSNLSIEQLAAVIGRARLFVGNNSGPLHLASALGIPTLSLMGPTVPERWWPLGNHQVVVRLGVSCSPCNLGWCSHHTCLRGIEVERVFQAVKDLTIR